MIEEKNHRAEEEDEKLHRHFHDRVEEQTDPARAQRTAGEITLHLRLVGAEIRERKKEAAENPRPDSVAPGWVEGKIDRLEFSHFARDGERAAERQVIGQSNFFCLRVDPVENFTHLWFCLFLFVDISF